MIVLSIILVLVIGNIIDLKLKIDCKYDRDENNVDEDDDNLDKN